MSNKNIFSNRLTELRNKRGIYAKDLADKIYVSKSAISLYETGKAYPTVEKLIEIADFLNVSIDYLVGRCDDPDRY